MNLELCQITGLLMIVVSAFLALIGKIFAHCSETFICIPFYLTAIVGLILGILVLIWSWQSFVVLAAIILVLYIILKA